MVFNGKPIGRNTQQKQVIPWSFLVLIGLAAWSHTTVSQTLTTVSEASDSLSTESVRELQLWNVDEEDLAQQQQIMDRIWAMRPALQTGWAWRSTPRNASVPARVSRNADSSSLACNSC